MALIADVITRVDESGGKDIRTLKSGSVHYQAVVLADGDGNQAGIAGNPAHAYVSSQEDMHGRIATQRKVEVLGGTFDKWVPSRLFTVHLENAGADGQNPDVEPSIEAGLRIKTGFTTPTKAWVKSKFEVPYIPGVGAPAEFDLRLTDIASPISGQIVRWGIGDTTNGVLIEWIASQTNKLQLTHYYNGTGTSTTSNNWDTPVEYSGGSGLLKDDKVQNWIIIYDWLRSRTMIFLDGTLVHDTTANATKPQTQLNGGRMMVENYIASSNANGQLTYVYGMHTAYLGRDSQRFRAFSRFNCAEHFIEMAVASSPLDMFALDFKTSRTNAQSVVVPNNRIARIRRMIIHSYEEGQPGAGGVNKRELQISKNVEITAAGTIMTHSPLSREPDYHWDNISSGAFTVAKNGVAATGSGYANSQAVDYKISSIGADGKSTASTAVAITGDVGNPKEKVKIQVKTPIPGVVGYAIYRREAAAGTYDLIGYCDVVEMMINGFIDNAFAADNGRQAPAADTMIADSFMNCRTKPTGTRPSGTELSAIQLAINHELAATAAQACIDFEDGALTLLPGENLVFHSTAIATNDVWWSIRVEWDEE